MQSQKSYKLIDLDFKKGRKIQHFVAQQTQNFLRQGGMQNSKIHIHNNLD